MVTILRTEKPSNIFLQTFGLTLNRDFDVTECNLWFDTADWEEDVLDDDE